MLHVILYNWNIGKLPWTRKIFPWAGEWGIATGFSLIPSTIIRLPIKTMGDKLEVNALAL